MDKQLANPVRNPEVMWKQLGTEVVTLNRKTNQYHVLSSAAALVFKSAEGKKTLEAIADLMTEAFGVDRSTGLRDVEETVAEMQKLGLLTPPAGALKGYQRPTIREVTEKDFNDAVRGGTQFVCRSLLGA